MIALLLVATAPDVSRLFTQEADIAVSKPGLQRLALPGEVLRACGGDLADLRVMGDGEVPFIVDSQRHLVLDKREVIKGEVRLVKHEQVGEGRAQERFDLVFASPVSGDWELVFDTPRPQFVRHVTIDQEAHGRIDAAVFRLPHMQRERVRLPLTLDHTKRLVMTLEGENDGFLEPAVRLERNTRIDWQGGTLTLPFTQVKLRSADKHTTLACERPRGVIPATLSLSADDAVFDRAVKVWDVRADGEALIGEGRIFRMEPRIEELAIGVRAARGDRLRIEIEDKDSPPLQGLAITATVDQPALVFSARDTRPLVLRFGGGRAARPDYDIGGLLQRGLVSGKRLEAAERLFAADQLSEAALGPLRANPAFDRTPFLQFAMRAGAAVDPRLYRWRRAFSVTAAEPFEGLTRLVPSVDDLALSRSDLGDLRIVDKQARQWPYLLLRDASTEERTVSLQVSHEVPHKTRYLLQLEAPRVRLSEVALPASEHFFDRGYELRAGEVVVASGRLKRSNTDRGPAAIRFATRDVEQLTLTLDDGDDAPLSIASAVLSVRLPILFLTAPAGDYFLLAGNPIDATPSYELEHIRDAVLGVPAQEAYLKESAPNPDYSAATKLASGPGPMQVGLWIAIVLAVLALAALTLRLAKPE